MACAGLDDYEFFGNRGDSGMTPERWQQIEVLYHAALEREPGKSRRVPHRRLSRRR